MKTLLLLLALVFLGGTVAHASLGESDAQVETRYGPTKDGQHPGVGCYWKMYTYRSMRVTVIFIDGKSEYETFGAAERFSLADVKALLAANARDGGAWFRPYEEGAELSAEPWGLSLLFDRREIATASVSDYGVFIMSEKWEKMHHSVGNGSSAPPEWLDPKPSAGQKRYLNSTPP